MYKVHSHVEAFAVDFLLARPMKVKLFERIFPVPHGDGASGGVVDHDRVTVIDDMQSGRLVVEMDLGQISFSGILDVNWGLAMPILACRELRFQVAPMAWTELVAVIPCMLRMLLSRHLPLGEARNR